MQGGVRILGEIPAVTASSTARRGAATARRAGRARREIHIPAFCRAPDNDRGAVPFGGPLGRCPCPGHETHVGNREKERETPKQSKAKKEMSGRSQVVAGVRLSFGMQAGRDTAVGPLSRGTR